MRIRFLEDRNVINHLGDTVQSFRAGEVVELSTTSARHWLNRNAAEESQGGKPVAKEAAPEVPTKPEEKPTTAFDDFREEALGSSHESGKDKQRSVSPPDQASQTATSSESESQDPKTDAGSSSSTSPTESADGPTSSTPPTPPGTARRRTRRASKAGKSASKD